MIRRTLQQLGCLVLICLSASLSAQSGWQDNSQEQQRLEDLKARIAQLEQEIRKDEKQLSREQQALAEIERRLQKTRTERLALESDMRGIEDELKRLRQSEQRTLADIDAHAAVLAEQARSNWSLGREPGLKLLLNAENPQQLARMNAYFGYFAEARSAAIELSREQARRLDALQAEIAQRHQTLKRKESDLLRNAGELEQQRSDHGRALAALEKSLRSDQQRLGTLRRDRDQLDRVLLELQEAVADSKLREAQLPFAERRSQLPWPIEGRVRLAYGRSLARGIASTGIVIESVLNSPVTAIHHGRVVFADRMSGFGQVIVIDHGDGFMSLYGYNEVLTRAVGDWIAPGDTLALSGRGGNTRQPGTYFEIRHQGKPENPSRWLKKRS